MISPDASRYIDNPPKVHLVEKRLLRKNFLGAKETAAVLSSLPITKANIDFFDNIPYSLSVLEKHKTDGPYLLVAQPESSLLDVQQDNQGFLNFAPQCFKMNFAKQKQGAEYHFIRIAPYPNPWGSVEDFERNNPGKKVVHASTLALAALTYQIKTRKFIWDNELVGTADVSDNGKPILFGLFDHVTGLTIVEQKHGFPSQYYVEEF